MTYLLLTGCSTDPGVLAKHEAEVGELEKKVEMWKADAAKFEERLSAATAKNSVRSLL